MWALENLGVNYEQFGSLLIPIILENLLNMIKLQISRKLGSGNWNVQDFLACINEEILAKENYEYLKRDNFEDPKPTSAFFTGSNVKCCVFCMKGNHYSKQCKIISNVKLRFVYNLIRRARGKSLKSTFVDCDKIQCARDLWLKVNQRELPQDGNYFTNLENQLRLVKYSNEIYRCEGRLQKT